ncbi:transglutaminase domain-containing protein [Candidatus Woesearchaeota archaeon]|nr:transglutaminase domain-containing protein [Candidatus Woesearchaeota archaeon]
MTLRTAVWAVLLLILATAAGGQSVYKASQLTIDTNITSSLQIPDGVTGVVADVLYYPFDTYQQRVVQLETSPDAERQDGRMRFALSGSGTLNYGIRSRSSVANAHAIVNQKVQFPLAQIPDDAKRYLTMTELIDADSTVVETAQKLAANEDDAFIVASKLALWVGSNIRYNLSTLTADVSQKASWVMANRQGVCDELSALFIAMARTLGIPARFVAGVAYTEDPLFPDRWGAHGWAEAWLGSAGWVPFDISYGEYGWLDPTHVTLRYELDPGEPSTKFEWRGEGKLQTEPLEINSAIVEVSVPVQPRLAIEVVPLKPSAGPGSYNLVTAKVKNLEDSYAVATLGLASVAELTAFPDSKQSLILKPKEEGAVTWTIQLTQDLKRGFEYTLPLIVYSTTGENGSSTFRSTTSEPVYSRSEVEAITPEKPAKAPEFSIDCTTDKEVMSAGEPNTVSCVISTTRPLPDVKVCLEGNCRNIAVLPDKKESVTLPLPYTAPGIRQYFITATAGNERASSVVAVTLKDVPNLNITGIHAPQTIGYRQEFNISFAVQKESSAAAQKVEISLVKDKVLAKWEVDSVNEDREFQLATSSAILSNGANEIAIKATWQDDTGKAYETSQNVTITLEGLTLWQRFVQWLSGLL